VLEVQAVQQVPRVLVLVVPKVRVQGCGRSTSGTSTSGTSTSGTSTSGTSTSGTLSTAPSAPLHHLHLLHDLIRIRS